MNVFGKRVAVSKHSTRRRTRKFVVESLEDRRVLAPIPIAAAGVPLTENFDTLASTGTANTTVPAGWEFNETGSSPNTTYRADTGASNAGDTYSYGAAGSTERAFGGLQSGTVIPTIGVSYINNTGFDLTSFAVQYVGENWRVGTANRPDRLDFQYSLDATSLTTGTWVDVNSLDFASIESTSAGAKDGNSAAFQRNISGVVAATLAAGATIYFRWTDVNATNTDDGMAIDNFSVTASATPALSISVNAGSSSQVEGNGTDTTYSFTVTRTGPTTDALTVDWAAAGSGQFAANSSDFTGTVSGTVSFASGVIAQTVTVTVAGDLLIEPDETFAVTLSNPVNQTSPGTGASVGTSSAIASIVNDDLQALSPGDIVITGINTTNPDQFSFVPLVDLVGNLPLKFTDAGWDETLPTPGFISTEGTVMYVTPAGGLTKGTKVVLEAPALTVTVRAGGGSASVTGNFNLNSTGESLFAFQGDFASPQLVFGINTNNAYLPSGSGAIVTSTTYLPPALTIGTSAVAALGVPTPVANAQYNHSVVVGSATTLRGLVADSAQWTTATTAIALNTGNLTVADVTQISIQAAPVVTAEGTGGTTTVTFSVTRSGDGLTSQTVNYAVVGSGASPAQAADFVGNAFPSGVVTFPADGTLTQLISISIATDSIVELDDSFSVQLSNASSGAAVGNATATGTILNDDYQALSAGQVLITGVNATNPDQFSFVPTVDLVEFTQVSFTDNAWTGPLASSGLSTSEGTVVYTVPAGGLAKGTKVVVTVSGGATLVGPGSAAVVGNFALNAAGDNLFAYLGLAASPVMLFGVNLNIEYLSVGSTAATTTYLPPALQIGTSAVAALGVGTPAANIEYDHTKGTSGTATALRDSVASAANWVTSGTAFVLNSTSFTISTAVTPTVTVTSAASVTYSGSAYQATASVTGDASPESKLTFTYYAQPDGQGSGSPTAPVGAGSYSVIASYAGDAALQLGAATSPAFNFTITRKTLNASASVANKVYDGTTAASVTNTSFGTGEVVSGDDVTATVASASFASRTVGTGKSVTVLLSGLSGTAAGNYQLASTSIASSANITVNALQVSLNAGAAQRSQVTELTLQFAAPLVFVAGDIELVNLDGLAVPTTVTTLNVAPGSAANSFRITFGAGTSVVSRGAAGGGNSLADGNYRLTQADNGNSRFGTAAVDRFFRLFGDNDGDGDVDGTDATAFRRAQLIYNAAFDADGNGSSNDVGDRSAFTGNYGKRRRAL